MIAGRSGFALIAAQEEVEIHETLFARLVPSGAAKDMRAARAR